MVKNVDQRQVLKAFCLSNDIDSFKRHLISDWKTGQFIQNHLSTLGADFVVKKITRSDKNLELQLWMMNSKEGFHKLRLRFLKQAAIIIIYNPDNSLENYLIEPVLEYIKTETFSKDDLVPNALLKKKLILYIGNQKDQTLKNLTSELKREQVLHFEKSEFFTEKSLDIIFNHFEPILFVNR